jgi:hypothetical protein
MEIPLLSLTILDAHIAAVLEQETDLIVRGKANAVGYRATRLQLEAVKEDILNHEIMLDDDKRLAHFQGIVDTLRKSKGLTPLVPAGEKSLAFKLDNY